jgi:hypothetical protein
MPMAAFVSALNSRKSPSMPSLNMMPFSGMSETIAIRAQVLDVELRLLDAVETDDQVVQARRPNHEHELSVVRKLNDVTCSPGVAASRAAGQGSR